MMKRFSALAIAVALALGSQQALALGLGQIEVKSLLGQPLLAEIPVRFDNPGEMKSLHLGIASPADYQRAGISTSQMGIQLQFALGTDAAGQSVIRVTTADPVRDPYISFLLDAGWDNGALVREYTVLLNPPGYSSATSGSISAAPVAPPATNASTAPLPTAPAASTAMPASASGSYTVRSGDTASAIAMRYQQAGVSLDQMLAALQQENPGAFMHDNINELRAGAILRIPDAAAARAISPAAARAAVRAQMQSWQARAPQPMLNASAAPAAIAAAAAAPAQSGRLELVPPAKGGGAVTRAGVAGGSGNESVAGIKQDLARAQDALASEKLHASDLKARVQQLEQINTNNGKLLALKNNEIAQLQAKLAQMEKPAAATSVKPALATSVAAAHGVAAAAAMAASTAQVAAAASSKPTPATSVTPVPTSKPVPKPVPVQKPAIVPPPPAQPWYMQPLALGAAAVIAVLVLLGLVFSRRKRANPKSARPSLADAFPAAAAAAEVAAPTDDEAHLQQELQQHPDDLGLYLELASMQYARADADAFVHTAEAMQPHVTHGDTAEWQAVQAMGAELLPQHPLFADAAAEQSQEQSHEELDSALDLAETAPDVAQPAMAPVAPVPHTFDAPAGNYEDPYASLSGGVEVGGDPVDTKLDLARAYLDMGDNDGARAMLEEVLHEGSQLQHDEAQRLIDSMR